MRYGGGVNEGGGIMRKWRLFGDAFTAVHVMRRLTLGAVVQGTV